MPHCHKVPMVGNIIVTTTGNKYVVGEIVKRDNRILIVPQGADEYTFWIPLENVAEEIWPNAPTFDYDVYGSDIHERVETERDWNSIR